VRALLSLLNQIIELHELWYERYVIGSCPYSPLLSYNWQ